MGLREILVFLDETDAAERRLKLAMSVAREHGACVSALFFPIGNAHPVGSRDTPAPWLGLLSGVPLGGGITSSETIDPTHVAEERYRDQIRGLGRNGAWLTFETADVSKLVAVAQAADLAILGQIHPVGRMVPKWRPEEIVIKSGRPVLMVPYVGSYAHVGRRVIVAWDGSREATRALNDALPLITAAKVVTLVTVYANNRARDQTRVATERMVQHLGRHGINSQVNEISQLGNSVADLILSRSVDLSADLMIAGAYHHSQWHEAIFGGVSREFFRHMTLPTLMSH
jgi:nucleotide-binding universal stress UspA family protein